MLNARRLTSQELRKKYSSVVVRWLRVLNTLLSCERSAPGARRASSGGRVTCSAPRARGGTRGRQLLRGSPSMIDAVRDSNAARSLGEMKSGITRKPSVLNASTCAHRGKSLACRQLQSKRERVAPAWRRASLFWWLSSSASRGRPPPRAPSHTRPRSTRSCRKLLPNADAATPRDARCGGSF